MRKGESVISLKSKRELFSTRANWQSARSSIQVNARRTWKYAGKVFKCDVCGYDKHAEIAHIKSVSEFPDDALIQDINAIENLIALCPNHHWEFDNLRRENGIQVCLISRPPLVRI